MVGGLFMGDSEEDIAYEHAKKGLHFASPASAAKGGDAVTDGDGGVGEDFKELMFVRKQRTAEEAAELHSTLKRQSRVYRAQIKKRNQGTLDAERKVSRSLSRD